MGTYDNFKDMPDQVRIEGQEITLTFTRNGDGTATLCWNIPKPAVGCSADNQAYDGIVLTVSNKPVNYVSTSPIDGTYYNGDASADIDINLGDKLDYARVIGAYYHDKETKCINVSDVLDKTPYYFSAYAVDKVGRYHREGIHAYSIPQTSQSFVGIDDSKARHDIEIDGTGITVNTLTGLVNGQSYHMDYTYNSECYSIDVLGANSMTYGNLVDAMNKEFALLSNPYVSPIPPNANEYIVDVINTTLYFWDGFTQDKVTTAVFWDVDISIPVLGTYWYNDALDALYEYETGGWSLLTNIIKYHIDPRSPVCDDLWFDGTTVWQWDGTIWCKLHTYISSNNPLQPPVLSCSTYWYNTGTDEFFAWNIETNSWDDSLVIVYEKDPNTITTGDFWLNETDEKIYIYLTGTFNELNNIRYEEQDVDGELLNPVANHYWFNLTEGKLYKRNVSNTTWVEQLFVSYPTNPTERKSCDLWWDTSISVNELFKWDELNNVWSTVDDFFETSIDPSLPPELIDNSAWYNPDTDLVELIMGQNCLPKVFVFSLTDPTATIVGDIWFNTTTSEWFLWNGVSWTLMTVLISSFDPYVLTVDSFWYDTLLDILYKWDGSIWVVTEFNDSPIVPNVGTLWYDSVNDILYVWNGTKWEETNSDVFVMLLLNKNTCSEGKDILCFMTNIAGCGNYVEILKTNNTLITGLTANVIWYDPVNGDTAFDTVLMSDQIGVGTDGSPDERRELQSEIRTLLGKSSIEVELTKKDLDLCIDNALRNVRKHSSYGYTRGFFFLDANPNQQKYILGGKCVGFNKIAYINEIYRTGPYSHGGNGGGDNSLFTFGALQQLYSLQTFDILSYHLISQYLEELETLFARKILFQWSEQRRELNMYQVFHYFERVLLDVSIERPEQDMIKDRELISWIQRWGVAEGKMILSQIRGKFQTLPGPNGSTTLNSQELITQAENEKAELIAEMGDMGMQDIVDTGLGSHFVIG